MVNSRAPAPIRAAADPLSRRDFLTLSAGALAAGALGRAARAQALEGVRNVNQNPKPRRPNIVLIMVDDMGWSDIGCYGGEIRTPNLDRLAAEGTRFTQFYNTARCCPSRAALLTGLYPHQTGVGHMIRDLGVPAYQGFLNDRCATLAEVLRPAGYATYMSGKWHVGEEPPHWPCRRGFDRYFGLISGACNYWRLEPPRRMAEDDRPFAPPTDGSFFMTDAFTERGIGMIRDHIAGPRAADPFFLYLAYTAPHWPLHAHDEDIARYRNRYQGGWDQLRVERHERQLAAGLVERRWPLSPRHPKAPAWDSLSKEQKAVEAEKMAVYAAQVDRMDQGVGRVLRTLDELGIADDTVVIFLSDNGGCAEEVERSADPKARTGTADSFRSYGLPWANASNTPLRLFKQFVHEGGIATPLIARGPGIRRGVTTDAVGHVIDLAPTCLDYAGAAYPQTLEGRALTPQEGRTLRPLFGGGTRAGHETIFWEHQGHRALRRGNWKLVASFGEPWELYDLEADRTETNNLAAAHPDLVVELAAEHQRWSDRVGARPWAELRGRLR